MFKLSWEVFLLYGVLVSFPSLASHLGTSRPSGSCLPWTCSRVVVAVVEGYQGRRLIRWIWVLFPGARVASGRRSGSVGAVPGSKLGIGRSCLICR